LFANEHGEKYLDCAEAERREALAQFGLAHNLPKMKADLKRYGIDYDEWFYESALHNSGYVADTVAKLTEAGYTYEQDGALWLKTADIIRAQLIKSGKKA
jgi:arginyl-tRNA synthetase